jgi:hypothetical protein
MLTLYPPGTKGFNISYITFLNMETNLTTPLVYANVSYFEYGNPDIFNIVLRSNEQEFV